MRKAAASELFTIQSIAENGSPELAKLLEEAVGNVDKYVVHETTSANTNSILRTHLAVIAAACNIEADNAWKRFWHSARHSAVLEELQQELQGSQYKFQVRHLHSDPLACG